MNKKFAIVLVIIGILVFSASAVYAQRGNGNRGNGNNGQNTECQMNCDNQQQAQQYQYGQQNDNRNNAHRNGNAVQNHASNWATYLPAKSDIPLSDAVVAAMIDGYMDEYNAYYIYQGITQQFGNLRPIFAVMNAEAQHMRAWEFLFDRYGIPLPQLSSPDMPIFTTYAEAVAFARDAEIANIGLYDVMLATLADYPDMVQVVTNLRNASLNNHLPAFERFLR